MIRITVDAGQIETKMKVESLLQITNKRLFLQSSWYTFTFFYRVHFLRYD